MDGLWLFYLLKIPSVIRTLKLFQKKTLNNIIKVKLEK